YIADHYKPEQLIFLDEASKDEHTCIITIKIIEGSCNKQCFENFIIREV
ncbi:17231_t:CDS:2, partial [Racocetra persica]